MRFLLFALLVLAPHVFAQTAPLNDTGQTLCFDAATNALAVCTTANTGDGSTHPRQDARFGRDPQAAAGDLIKIGAGAAGFDYTRICNSGEAAGSGACPADLALGTGANQWACTRDNVTGLIWEVKTPANAATTFTFEDASDVHAAAVNNAQLCGIGTWRVPARRELLSIVHLGAAAGPRIDTTFFPNTVGGLHWSNDDSLFNSTVAWVVAFTTGAATFGNTIDPHPVRLVAGALAAPAFTVNLNGTVTDSVTGLMWDRCSWGQAWNESPNGCTGGATTHTWPAALEIAVAANTANHRGYSDWRLPNYTELESLVDISADRPAIDPDAFPSTPNARFWSSTAFPNPDPAAWYVNFTWGDSFADFHTVGNRLRLVRSEQFFDILAPLHIAINAGEGQSAPSGTAVAIAPSVLVTDAINNPVAGVEVMFAVASDAGSVTDAAATTNASGIATVGSWTLDTTAGTNMLTATAAGIAEPLTFTATGTVGPASRIAILVGNGQSATVGTAVAIAPSVIVRDANDNPVAGFDVTFAVTTGGGTVDPTTAVNTDSNGIATVTSWTLGTTAGINWLEARAQGLTGSPLTFTASGLPGTATKMEILVGDDQSATAGTEVDEWPMVVVRDANNNTVGGVQVTFAVALGSGTVVPTTPLTTDAFGIAAAFSWTLGPEVGINTLTATADGIAEPVTFTAMGTTVPTAPAAANATAGNAQATVSWTAPADDGGSPVTAYTVTAVPDGQTCATKGETSCTVTGLTNGTEYTFTVIATNSSGDSPASEPSNAVVPSDLLFQDRFEEP